MRKWYLLLSVAQQRWLWGTLAAMFIIVAAGWLFATPASAPEAAQFDVGQSLSEIAPSLGVTGSALAKELGLNVDAPKKKPLSELGIDQATLDEAAEHLLSHEDTLLKYFIYLALTLGATVYLVRLGRPDGSPPAERRNWYPRTPYLASLIVAVIVCGFMFGKSPNPMEGIVKVFKTMAGLYPDPLFKTGAFLFFLALVVVGNKVICGWACPFGALQEKERWTTARCLPIVLAVCAASINVPLML